MTPVTIMLKILHLIEEMDMTRDEIVQELFRQQDQEYGNFQGKLIPTVDPDRIIGVRTPALRKMAKQLAKQEDTKEFLDMLPHHYFEENQLHAFIISEERDFDRCIAGMEQFLPFIDNWATCDQTAPKAFKKHTDELLVYIRKWIASEHTYTVRYAIGMLMRLYLDEEFKPEYLDMVAAVRSEEYYVKMMVAWYFATALAKQYDAAIPFIEERKLEPWTHNKTIQKSVESYRIDAEKKAYLKLLKV